MQFRVCFDFANGTHVDLGGTYDPPGTIGEGLYGHFQVEKGHVIADHPMQIASADGLEGHTLDAIVGRALKRIGRATW